MSTSATSIIETASTSSYWSAYPTAAKGCAWFWNAMSNILILLASFPISVPFIIWNYCGIRDRKQDTPTTSDEETQLIPSPRDENKKNIFGKYILYAMAVNIIIYTIAFIVSLIYVTFMGYISVDDDMFGVYIGIAVFFSSIAVTLAYEQYLDNTDETDDEKTEPKKDTNDLLNELRDEMTAMILKQKEEFTKQLNDLKKQNPSLFEKLNQDEEKLNKDEVMNPPISLSVKHINENQNILRSTKVTLGDQDDDVRKFEAKLFSFLGVDTSGMKSEDFNSVAIHYVLISIAIAVVAGYGVNGVIHWIFEHGSFSYSGLYEFVTVFFVSWWGVFKILQSIAGWFIEYWKKYKQEGLC